MPDPADAPSASPRATAKFTPGEGGWLLGGFVAVSLAFAAFVAMMKGTVSTTALPMLAIVGIALLLICLAAIAYVFTRLGISDSTQALGLPTGSIQSVIALSLIVLFAILSIFVFTTIDGSIREIPGLTAAERDAQIPLLGPAFAGWKNTGNGTFTLYVTDTGLAARSDIGKQLVVLIGTLMTSAVSFYFGTRATQSVITQAAINQRAADQGTAKQGTADQGGQARDADRDDTGTSGPGGKDGRPATPATPATVPTITQVLPDTGIGKAAAATLTILGTGLEQAGDAALVRGDARYPVSLGPAAPGEVTGTVTLPADASPGLYDLVLTVAGQEVRRDGAMTVT